MRQLLLLTNKARNWIANNTDYECWQVDKLLSNEFITHIVFESRYMVNILKRMSDSPLVCGKDFYPIV